MVGHAALYSLWQALTHRHCNTHQWLSIARAQTVLDEHDSRPPSRLVKHRWSTYKLRVARYDLKTAWNNALVWANQTIAKKAF